jgi:hypothetical protein
MEKDDFVDQRRAAVRQLVAEHAALSGRQGSVQASWRWRRGKKLGPFFRLSYRRGETQASFYLGADEALAEEVRQLLAPLQAPLRQRLERERRLAQARALLRQHKQDFRQEISHLGLTLKGSEIRGWRSLPAGQRGASKDDDREVGGASGP